MAVLVSIEFGTGGDGHWITRYPEVETGDRVIQYIHVVVIHE